ncbi:hypothetical protein DPEC_G00246900 [Dallia pectoralis]|uniref:Uncharacterized protein n=1 Tax=Dallia pectoralis TaxID=75939 RepID=A0ACC2FWD6_DALPE|nr:hypothetical protein DPEC_G00246900 [Dallia pectoralis]
MTTSRQRKDQKNPNYTKSERTSGQYLSDLPAPRWICPLSGCPSSTLAGQLPATMNPGGMRRYNAVRLTLTPTREAAEDGANQGRGTATATTATATGTAKKTRQHDDPPGIQQGSSTERYGLWAS